MANIVGGVTSINNPRTNWAQTDAKKADFLKNKPSIANALIGHNSGASISVDDVSPNEHELDVKVRSKNIFPNSYIGKTITLSGITGEVKSDGSIVFNGKPTATFYWEIFTKTFVTPCDCKFTAYTPETVGEVSASTYFAELLCTDLSGNPDYRKADTSGTGGIVPKGYTIKNMHISFKAGEKKYENLTFKPQLEYGTVPTEFTPPSIDVEGVNVTVTDGENSQTATADSDGNVTGLMSMSPSMTLTTDNASAVIECEYNRDANKVVTDLETKLNTLIATIGG